MKRITEELAVVATIDPQTLSTGTATSSTTAAWTDAINMKSFHKALFLISVGTLSNTDIIDFTVYSDEASATGGMTTTVKAITQLTAADDNKQAIVEVDMEDVAFNHDFLRGKLVVSVNTAGNTASAPVSVIALAGPPRFGPASNNDLSSVDEIAHS